MRCAPAIVQSDTPHVEQEQAPRLFWPKSSRPSTSANPVKALSLTFNVTANQMGTGEMEKKTLTFCEYDQKQVWSKLGTMAMGVAITGGVYYKWAYIQPLLIQAVLQPLNYFTDPLFLVVVMGADATKGSNKRPWKTDKPRESTPPLVVLLLCFESQYGRSQDKDDQGVCSRWKDAHAFY